MAVTGSLLSTTPLSGLDSNVRLPASIQIVLFMTSTALFITLGRRALRRRTAPVK